MTHPILVVSQGILLVGCLALVEPSAIAGPSSSGPVLVGKQGIASGSVSAVVSADEAVVYLLGDRGELKSIELGSGVVRVVGRSAFEQPHMLFRPFEDALHVVAGDSIYHVHLKTGAATPVEPRLDLNPPSSLRHAVRCDGRFYVTRSSGGLASCVKSWPDPAQLPAMYRCTSNQSPLDGCKGWGARYVRGAKHMACIGGELAAIQYGGQLMLLPVAEKRSLDRQWRKVGTGPAWKDVLAAVGRGKFLFTAEKDGALWKTDMQGNRTKVIGKGFAKTKFLLTAGPVKLVVIDVDGNIFMFEV